MTLREKCLLVLALVCLIEVAGSKVQAETLVPTFTKEQQILLDQAYIIGKPYNLGYTLQAIIWQESFVGKYVVRINPKDGKAGSYGVSHIQLTTAMALTGETNEWRAKAELLPRLMTHDAFAISLSLNILYATQKQIHNWHSVIAAYNGGLNGIDNPKAQVYADAISEKVKYLQMHYKN